MNHDLRKMIEQAQDLQRRQRVPEAIGVYKSIVTRWPHQAVSWFNLGFLQRQSRQWDDALESYRRALDLGIAEPEEVHLNRSVIYTDYLGDDAAAEYELGQALHLNAQYVPALMNLANLCEDRGRRHESLALYQRILDRDPRRFDALARYANLHPAASDALLSRLRKALADAGCSMADRASLGFALGRLLDLCGRYDAAFDAYSGANNASRASTQSRFVPYDRLRHEDFIDRLIRVSRASQPRSNQICALGQAGMPRPIFICGMFRSGSTLTEQMLAADPGITPGGELEFIPRQAAIELAPFPESLLSASQGQLAGFADRYLADLNQKFPLAACITDKRPDNFLYIGLIKTLFPDAKIIHSVRNALDNCLSIFFLHLDQSMSYALDLEDIGHYYLQYQRLMAHWKSMYGTDIYDFVYDDFVHKPDLVGEKLFRFLKLEWNERRRHSPSAEHSIRTASVWQVREPIYTRSSGRALNYRKHVAALQKMISPHSTPSTL